MNNQKSVDGKKSALLKFISSYRSRKSKSDFLLQDRIREKIVIIWHYRRKLRLKEIASLLDLPYTMVRKRHSRFKEKTGALLTEIERGEGSRTEE